MKEKLIELFTKIGNETDTFAPFITCDEFENLADEIVKLCNLQNVSQQRELLYGFITWYNAKGKSQKGEHIYTTDVDDFLKP